MAFNDDDEEEDVKPKSASGYYFENNDETPVSFAELPIQWSVNEKVDGSAARFYLRTTPDIGTLPLYNLVKAWRFDLSTFRPEISVLTKDNKWIKLEKPRKSYEKWIRSVLITLQSLHFLRRNPQASDKSLWEHLSKIFKQYDVKPSQNDLVNHIDLIAEVVERDVNLAKSKFILAFLAKKPTKKKLPDEENRKDDFIVGDDAVVVSDEDESDDEDEDFFESVCAICDNGGELLCCEGSCLRSFHATEEDGEDSHCDSLELTKNQVEEIQKYFCPNCEHKIHQCFICKKLGSSNNSTGEAKVFQCVSATCGYFYHPHCVTKRLHLDNEKEAEALEKQIIAGEFICPLHKCSVCGNGEVKTDTELQFAVCRRCPKSYHRKCLPQEISFKDIEDEDILTRAWDELLHNRVLIYCQEHEIDEELLTPLRDHVKFPFTEEKKVAMPGRTKIIQESHVGREKVRHKVNELALPKVSEKSYRSSVSSSKDGVSTKNHGLASSVLRTRMEGDSSRKYKLVQQKSQKTMEYIESREAGKNKVEVNDSREAGKRKLGVKRKASLGERLSNNNQEANMEKPRFVVTVDSKRNKTDSISSKEPGSEIPTLDNNSQRRLLAIMKSSMEEITMDTMIKKYKVPSTHASSTRNVVDKTITMGKVEGSVQAVRTALKKLEQGGNIEDAKAICEPEVLSQILKWKDKLKVYLAPFLHGARYTSFGRHFTNIDKLQQIVDRLHWYADDGDMIVDFCCGANDFSCLMNAKLEETGKKCLYKNFDLFPAKKDFNFEKRDWMTVGKDELEPGSKLIIGLNPPFGVNASLANKFITKALEFRPKILILIVPLEAERLDKKKSSYVLIWEDETLLSGKSFYLPGSVNDEDKQLEDWNKVPPPLYLWSRPDFAAKHKEIAEKHYHLSKYVGSSKLKSIEEEEENESLHPFGASDDICDDNSMPRDSPLELGENSRLEYDDVPMEIDEFEVEECVNNVLLSEKIEPLGTVACATHQPDQLSTRSQLEMEEKAKDYSVRDLGKSVDSDWKSNDTEEDQGELNRGPTEMASNLCSPVRSPDDDIYALCTSISNTPQRSHVSIEASLPVITREKRNLEKNIKESNSKAPSIVKPGETLNRPRSSREDISTVRPSPANTGQKPYEAFEPSYGAQPFSHFDDGLAARYGLGGGYRMSDPNEMFDNRGYSDRRFGPRDYHQQQYGGNLDPMLPPPPNLMDNLVPMQQRYAPHFDVMNYQRMSSFPPPPPMQPSGHNLHGPGYPQQPPPPPPGNFGMGQMGFAPAPNYPYMDRSGGWINE